MKLFQIKKITHIFAFLILTSISHCTLTNHTAQLFEISKRAETYVCPHNIDALQTIVTSAAESPYNSKISLVGADKSQGGQTTSFSGSSIRINLKNMNKLINLDLRNKQVTVEAGMTWGQLQQHIAPHRLAIKTMQSYNDFSIGGSLGVNVHGQDFRDAPLIETVVQCKILLADGSTKTISRIENPELFSLAIGGYGLFGIIYEVTLSLTDDVILQRNATVIPSTELYTHFTKHIKHNPNIAFYSGRFSMGASNLLDQILIITYEHSAHTNNKLFDLTSPTKDNWKKYLLEFAGKLEVVKNVRLYLETLYNKIPQRISRNNMLNYSIEILPQDTPTHAHILQEYFIPYQSLNSFIHDLKHVIQHNNINIINVTARHVHKNTESVLSYSQDDVCALVLYIKIDRTKASYNTIEKWTQQLIGKAIEYKGTYYLPYHLLATKEQIRAAYPRFQEFTALKRTYDPQELFTNMLYEKYQ